MRKISFVGSLTSVFLIGITAYAIFGVFNIQDYNALALKLIFFGLAIIIDAVIMVLAPMLRQILSLPFFMGISTVAGIYTVAQTVLFGVFFAAESAVMYVLLSLVLLFFFAVIAAIFVTRGSSGKTL